MIEMYSRVAIYSLVVLLLTSSVVVLATGNAGASPSPGPSAVTDWSGYLTIYPDGSLSDTSAPVVQSGYNYTLTGNITGTITVEYTGANLNGAGYSVSNSVGISPITVTQADSVVITNFTVYSLYAADINLVYSSHDLIVNNTIYAMVAGVFVYSPYNEVINNTINVNLTTSTYSGASTGVMVKGSETNVSGNAILMNQTGYGIVLDTGLSGAHNNTIQLNIGNSVGVVSTGASNKIYENTVNGSGIDSFGVNLQAGTQDSLVYSNDINLTGSRNVGVQIQDGMNTIQNNSIAVNGSYSYGVTVTASGTGHNGVSMNNISVIGTGSVGIYDTSQESNITENTVNATGYQVRGISISNPGYVTFNNVTTNGDRAYGISAVDSYIAFNSISSNGNYTSGLYVGTGSYGKFVSNSIEIIGNDSYGVQLNGQHQLLEGNSVTAGFVNGFGLYESALTFSTIANNSITNSTTGLLATAHSSYSNTYVGNYFFNDSTVFRIYGISSNLFYHNSFINYTTYLVTGSGNATWDNGYPSGGNYWYLYDGVDLYHGPSQNLTGSDGIGDTQFNVTSNNVDHYPLMKAWEMPRMIFTETGLAAGTAWSVTFNGAMSHSTESSIVFYLTVPINATYGFTVHPVTGYTMSLSSGSVDYNGSNVVTNVVFTPIPAKSYNIVFTQSGLPSGTSWSVQLGGTMQTSTSSSITFDPVNGTYSYTVSGVSGYRAGNYSGTIVVNGADVTTSVVFTQVVYSVTFYTKGLPSGMTWYVNLSNGKSYSSTSSIISFEAPNGTYSYTVDNVSDYNSTPRTGSISVSGSSPTSVQIDFNKTVVVPPPVTNNFDYWLYIILGIIIGGAVVGTVATIVYYARRRNR